jgi:hypothetical protein
MADSEEQLGLSVAIGAGVGAALGVALHHLPFWLSLGCVGGIVTGIIGANDAILILPRYFGSLGMLLILLLVVWRTGCDQQCV